MNQAYISDISNLLFTYMANVVKRLTQISNFLNFTILD